MHNTALLYLFCVLSGFALIKVPLSGFLTPLQPLAFLVGVLTILLFSCIIIFHGVLVLLGRRR